MKVCFLLSVLALIIGLLLIVLGIAYGKKLSPVVIISLILLGTLIVIISTVMCLSLGFFMT
jgi:hypothetical protein